MADSKGFSFSMAVDPNNTFDPLPDLVAFDLCRAYPVPGGDFLLHNTRNGKRAMVRPEVYASLKSCQDFQTLERHTRTIINANPGMQGQQAEVQQVLQTMQDSGILVSAKEICDSLKRGEKQTAEDKIHNLPVVAIITWERPQALERLLESIAANCAVEKFDRFYVIDDSRNSENISKNQEIVETFFGRTGITVQYFGQDEQQALLQKLSRHLPEHENEIRFLADQSKWRDQWTSGLARNIALLLSCDHRLVMLDDDTVCEVFNPPQARPEITVSDETRQADFFGTEQEWAHQRQSLNPDPIDRHMQCLGLTFSECLEVLGSQHLKPVSFANSTALLSNELQRNSPVLITECGSLGCPGTSTNTWLPDIEPNSLKRMLASPQKTKNALKSRLVWSGRNHPHFAPRPNMSQITGFDNRQLLPPYLPILRGEDRLFGNMLDFVYPNAVTLDYPWAIPHRPIPQRNWRKEDLVFKAGNLFPLFFVEQVIGLKSTCLSTSPVDRLMALSTWFEDLSSASESSISAMYRDDLLSGASERLIQLQELLENNESSPAEWQDYVKNGINQLTTDMEQTSREEFKIEGLPKSLDSDALLAYWKDVWAGFGSAVKAWPEIRQAAKEILNP